jgi:hypothetical protein
MTELLISIVVLVALLVGTSVSLGLFSGQSSRSDLHEATSFLLDQLEFARVGATMRNQAFEVVFDTNSLPQTIVVRSYGANHCQALAVPVRTIPFTSNADGPSGWSGGTTGAPRFSEVTMVGITPSDLAGICFRPDGRVTRPDGRVIDTDDPSAPFAAGEASIALRMRNEKDSALGITHRVVVSYNGLAKIEYEVPQ